MHELMIKFVHSWFYYLRESDLFYLTFHSQFDHKKNQDNVIMILSKRRMKLQKR